MDARGAGQGMDSNFVVPCCERPNERWYQNSVRLLGARGIKYQRQLAQQRGRELAGMLKPGQFVAIQDRIDGHRGGNEEPFMIGVTVDTGEGSCVAFKQEGARATVDGTRFDPGDWGIAVRWLHRLEEDAEQRTFELEGGVVCGVDAPKVVVINSTELRWHSIEMDLLEATGPAVRRSARTAARGSGSGEHLARKYRLPTNAEVAILKECW
jgi:hypothetical protein